MQINPYLGANAERIEGSTMPKKSTTAAPKAPAAAPNNKSAMTNDPLKLEDVDGRSKVGRRLRDLTASLTALVAVDGKPLDDVVAASIKLAAAGTLRGEQIAAAIGRGEVVKDEDLVRIQNAANRTMRELRDLKAARSAAADAGMSPLDRIAAEIAARREQPVEIEDEDDDADFEPVPGFDDVPEPDCTPSAPENAAPDAPEPVAPAPVPKPEPVKPLTLKFDMRAGRPGELLHAIVTRLVEAGHEPATPCDVVTPAEGVKSTIGEAMNAPGFMRERASWFVVEADQ